MVEQLVCERCVMDRSDPQITFGHDGTCNHCIGALATIDHLRQQKNPERLSTLVRRVQESGRGKTYDCIIGLSGGVDSSFLAYKAKRLGLRPLAIHLDNGWDSELAVKNIENVVRKLDLDLYTHVVDWPEFRDIQLSFFKADVIDIEMITDHAIMALAFDQAVKHGVHHILTGVNTATESILPAAWVHAKTDLRNLKAIHRKHGDVPLRTLPTVSTLKIRYFERFKRIRLISLLDLIDYDKRAAMKTLEDELGWTNYGGKHHESIFTRFYQQYILPEKFGVDKRKAHLSSLICAGQVTRSEALDELARPPHNPDMIEADKAYVTKKLGMSPEALDAYIQAPRRSHYEYPSEQTYLRALSRLKGKLRGVSQPRRDRLDEAPPTGSTSQ